jgi:hypothetical protein
MKPEDLPPESESSDNPTQERNKDNENDQRRADADSPPAPQTAADTQPSSNRNADIQSLSGCGKTMVRLKMLSRFRDFCD